MLGRILPERIDNDYRSHKLALWAFYPITFLTVVRSLIHVFRSDPSAAGLSPPFSATQPNAYYLGRFDGHSSESPSHRLSSTKHRPLS